jgi:hypothetical protein
MHDTNIDLDSITAGLQTKSDKIRALAREGVETADIARYLGIRYQHARNVLVNSGLHIRRGGKNGAPVGEGNAVGEPVAWVNIDASGRLSIPAHLLKAAGIEGDEPVHVRASDDGIEILSRRAALKRAQTIARQFVPEGVSLVDELIAERRREAGLEDE